MIEELTLRKALEFAIKTEELGASFYDEMAEKFQDKAELKELFSVLARDEEVHQFQFKSLLKDLPADEKGEVPEHEQEYLQAISADEIFFGPEGPADKPNEIKDLQDGLERAVRLERSALLFYASVKEILGPSSILDEIIQTEKDHLVRVMKFMVTGAKTRSLLEDY
jgi:rubrerythrin